MLSFAKFFGLFRREVHRFCKVPLQTIGTPIVSALLYILIFGVSLGDPLRLGSDLPYLAFLIPGLLAMAHIKNAFENSSSSIIGSKYVNELQDLRVTPLSRHHIVWALACGSLIRGLFVAMLTFIVGICFYPLPIAHPFMFLLILITSGLAFGHLGLAIAMRSRSFEQISTINSFILVPLIYLGGTFFPTSRLHPAWQTISHFNPIFYIINGIRYATLGIADASPLLCILVTVSTLIISYGLALHALKPGAAYSRTL